MIKKIELSKTGLMIPQVALGCMRICDLSRKDCEALLATALENGINFFDHADIYADGQAETFFSQSIGMNDDVREKIILQSKCGIHLGKMYDCSKSHILASVDRSLKRLNTDYLDIFLLHRPDALVEPEEVAEALAELQQRGKVKYIGVSNHNPYQIELLQKYCKDKIVVNQMQFSITESGMVDAGLNVNMKNDAAVVRDGGVLDYCRLHDITMQAWSPFQYGFFEGVFLGNYEKFGPLNNVLDRLAEEKNVNPSALAVAWIARHPAHIQTIVGTTNAGRLRQICQCASVELSRDEWYEIYLASGKKLP